MNIEQHTIFSGEQLDSYFASYVGMEGGNPAAAVWFCDSSPPANAESLVAPLTPQARPSAWNSAYREKHRDHMERWVSHQKIARIMAAARAQISNSRIGEPEWKDYFDRHLYAPDGAEFKLSLFPLPASHINEKPWSKAFRGQPALVPRQRYLDLCRDGKRFPFIDGLRRFWRPKVVVCLGERHLDDFVQAFALTSAHAAEHVLQPADQPKTLRLFERDGTTWIICPALAGTAGLTSGVLLDAMGQYLSRWLEPADFPLLTSGADSLKARQQ
jgi:transcriptional activator of eps genes